MLNSATAVFVCFNMTVPSTKPDTETHSRWNSDGAQLQTQQFPFALKKKKQNKTKLLAWPAKDLYDLAAS